MTAFSIHYHSEYLIALVYVLISPLFLSYCSYLSLFLEMLCVYMVDLMSNVRRSCKGSIKSNFKFGLRFQKGMLPAESTTHTHTHTHTHSQQSFIT